MILTVGSIKGGVGKTTLALNLAILRALKGRAVWLIDADRQATAMTALAVRGNKEPVLACAGYTDGRLLLEQVKRQRGSFEDIVIDAGGRDSSTLRAAIVLCDVLLVPLQPRSLDVWTLEAMTGLITEASALRGPVEALAVLNMADSLGHDNDEARQAIEESGVLKDCGILIRRRKAFANAAGQGLSVAECRPRDPKAVDELETMAGVVFGDGHLILK